MGENDAEEVHDRSLFYRYHKIWSPQQFYEQKPMTRSLLYEEARNKNPSRLRYTCVTTWGISMIICWFFTIEPINRVLGTVICFLLYKFMMTDVDLRRLDDM